MRYVASCEKEHVVAVVAAVAVGRPIHAAVGVA
jgi:hypothetical protein